MDTLLTEFSTFGVTQYTGVEDAADKASFLFSLAIISASVIIVTTNTYFLSSIDCYMGITASGKGMEDYFKNYCWVHGTIPQRENMTLPTTKLGWEELDRSGRINYYQWVPFVLGLQGVMYFIPRLLWQLISHSLTGSDIEGLVVSAKSISNKIGDDRVDGIKQIARWLYDICFYSTSRPMSHVSQRRCCTTGHCLFISYFIVKIAYLINAIGQLWIMKIFIGGAGSAHGIIYNTFGWQLFHDLYQGRNWRHNGIFPRVTYCYLGQVRSVGTNNQYLAQCALPINMLNEKIYIFLWCWTWIVLAITITSLPLWLWRIFYPKQRQHFFKRIFADQIDNSDNSGNMKERVDTFIRDFLRNDGVFILRMLSINAGDIITKDIVRQLWLEYTENYNRDNNSAGQNYISDPNYNRHIDDDDDDKAQFV